MFDSKRKTFRRAFFFGASYSEKALDAQGDVDCATKLEQIR